MALVNPCTAGNAIKNTGTECNDAMLATYALVMMPKAAVWDANDELDFTGYINTMLHAPTATRWYWLFGRNAKINGITDSNEADVTEKLEDGSNSFVRNGMLSVTFMTTKGLCFAKALRSIPHDYAFVEIDLEGKVNRMVNSDGTFSGFPVNVAFAPTPDRANFKTVFKNKFMLDFSPADYYDNGDIVKGDSTEDILSLKGLVDAKVVDSPAIANSTTKIYVDVKTVCAETDLIALYGSTLAVLGNFVLHNAVGTVNTPSAVAIASSRLEFTGTFATGTNIKVSLSAASVLKAAGIVGYEGIVSATCPIP
jgi:hypothetical protein